MKIKKIIIEVKRTNIGNQKIHSRNQTDKLWKSIIVIEIKRTHFGNQKIISEIKRTRKESKHYFSDTPRTPYL